MTKQGKQQIKSRASTKQQGLRGLGGRIKARNRPQERDLSNNEKAVSRLINEGDPNTQRVKN